jgi:hypothetical protein
VCHGIDEASVALGPQIGFAVLQFDKKRFSGFDSGHYWGAPSSITIDAYAEVNFVGPRVSFEQRDE